MAIHVKGENLAVSDGCPRYPASYFISSCILLVIFQTSTNMSVVANKPVLDRHILQQYSNRKGWIAELISLYLASRLTYAQLTQCSWESSFMNCTSRFISITSGHLGFSI